MDVVWQDSVGSFLDSAGSDPGSFASFADDGGALWSSVSDSPLFSSEPVLWQSGADAPADSHLGALIADSSVTDSSALLAGGWIADAGSGFVGGSATLHGGGLMWAGAGSNTASTLSSNGGVGLGALDLGASSGSLWQQFVDQFASGAASSLGDVPQLLWTSPAGQLSITVPVVSGLQPLQVGASDSVAATLGNLAPTQLVWTQPSAANGLTVGPSLAGAAPTTLASNLGGPVQDTTGLPTNLGVTR